MIRDHVAAVLALLEADTGLVVFDSRAPTADPPDRYVVLSMSSPARRQLRLSASSPKQMLMFSTLCVGLTPNECRWVVEHVHAALIGKRPPVSGRICDPILPPLSPDEVTPDDDINPPAYVCTDVWSFNTSPIQEAA